MNLTRSSAGPAGTLGSLQMPTFSSLPYPNAVQTIQDAVKHIIAFQDNVPKTPYTDLSRQLQQTLRDTSTLHDVLRNSPYRSIVQANPFLEAMSNIQSFNNSIEALTRLGQVPSPSPVVDKTKPASDKGSDESVTPPSHPGGESSK